MFVFNVSGFSNYYAASNSKLSVDIVEDNGKVVPDETVYFYVNYTNRSSSASVNGSGVNCSVSFDGTYNLMSFNNRYQYNTSFANLGVKSYVQEYNVSCLGSALGFEDINYSSSFNVILNATMLTLNQSLEGVWKSSVVVFDWNMDGKKDLIVSGVNYSLDYVSSFYHNKNYSLIFNWTQSGKIYGTMGTTDYDKDGDLDLISFGESNSGFGSVNTYKKE